MSRQYMKLLLILVNSVLKSTPLTDDEKAQFTPEFIQKTAVIAEKHKLLPIVANALIANKMLDPSDELFVKLRKLQLAQVYKAERMEYELGRMCDELEKAGIEFVPLKGSVVRRLYPEPWMRTSCDIDILVKKEDIEKAVTVLTDRLEYLKNGESFHDIKFKTPSKINIELHFNLIEDEVRDSITAVLDDAWQHTAPIEGHRCYMQFDNEFFVLYHIIHMAKHMTLGGCGIRPFIDLWLIRKNLKFDDGMLNEMFKRSSVMQFAAVSYRLCDIWFANIPHDELTLEAEEFILRGGVFGTTGNSAAIQRGEGKSKGKQFLKLMFLPSESLKLIYPNLKKHPWLLPFYQVKRWFRVFDRSKRNKIAQRVDANDRISDETVDRVAKLMSDLELN